MRSRTFGVALWLLPSFVCIAQPTYVNVREPLGYLATVFTGLYPTDSCVYIKGVMTDSFLRSGSFFSKVDLEGSLVWKSELTADGKDYNSWSTKLVKNHNDNFILAGTLFDPTPFAYLAEYDCHGNLIQYHHFRSPFFPTKSYIVPRGLCVIKGGGYAISGILEGTSQQNQNLFLTKLNDTLGVEWTKIYGTSGLRKSNRSLLYNQGHFLLGGMEYNSLSDKNITCRKHIFKVDSIGATTLSEWRYPSPPLPPVRGWTVYDMLPLPDGSIIGASAVSREVPINASSSQLRRSPSMFKLSPDQNLLWETRIGNGNWADSHCDMIRVVPANDDGGYVGTGTLHIIGNLAKPYTELGFLCKVAENGDSLWMRYLYFWSDSLDNYYHEVHDLAPAPNGGYWLCGQVQRQVSGEPLQQGWLLRTDNYGCLSPGCQLVGTSESPLEDKISLYPNPASGYLVVHHAGYPFQKGRFSILNLQGQVVRDWAAPMDDLSTVFDVSQFPAGGYVLQYREEGVVRVVKQFVVVRP